MKIIYYQQYYSNVHYSNMLTLQYFTLNKNRSTVFMLFCMQAIPKKLSKRKLLFFLSFVHTFINSIVGVSQRVSYIKPH